MNLRYDILKYLKGKSLVIAISIITSGLAGYVRFYALPKTASTSIEILSEAYGLDIMVGDFTYEIMDLKVNFEDVVWYVRGKYSSNELFTADRISFGISNS